MRSVTAKAWSASVRRESETARLGSASAKPRRNGGDAPMSGTVTRWNSAAERRTGAAPSMNSGGRRSNDAEQRRLGGKRRSIVATLRSGAATRTRCAGIWKNSNGRQQSANANGGIDHVGSVRVA